MGQSLLGEAGAFELAAAVRDGRVSASALVGAHIARTESVNPIINALIADRFDLARAEALQIDARRSRGETLPVLAGVPFSVKEMIDSAGMPSTFGSHARRDRRALRDATIVQRLRAVGAIPIGSTNIPEWGLWYETANLIYGRTSNPHNPGHTTGGSSGGEAAIVAAGGSVFGLGSDIGGSIRIPSALCGVYGHKPSTGLLPLTGHYPVYAEGPDAGIDKNNGWEVVGPITRTARDLMPLLRLMAGPDGIDPNARSLRLAEPPLDWRGRDVFVLDDPRIARAGRATRPVRAVVREAAQTFAQHGARLVQFEPAFFHAGVNLWFAALQSLNGPPLARLLAPQERLSIVRELLRHVTGQGRYSLPALGFCAVEALTRMTPSKLQRMLEQIYTLRKEFDARLANAILLMPPHPRTAPRHHHALLHPFGFAYTALFNTLQAPATVAPAGIDRNGLPFGVQIASAHGNDGLTIGGALLLESVRPRTRPHVLPR